MLALFLLFACDDVLFQPSENGTLPPGTEGWCAAEQILASDCAGCHSASAAAGGLDLETDPHAAIVDVPSATNGELLVAPGDPDGSLLLRKMEDTQRAGEGGVMPPGAALDAATVALVRQWIADGADDVCDQTITAEGYHPPGWAEPDVHGIAMKFQTETDCRACHGTELEGGTGPSCTSCHGEDWEITCTFCHGGVDSSTGAPPEGIDDTTGPQVDTFIPHTTHLSAGDHATIACDTCHTVPTTALFAGHVFDDDTPGIAEVTFSNLATNGAYASGSCEVYCHGNGRAPAGDITHTDGPRNCSSCHGGPGNAGSWSTMSGEHRKHLGEGLACTECHASTTDRSNAIIGPDLHVNGTPDIDVTILTYNETNGTCTGVCHGETHNGRRW